MTWKPATRGNSERCYLQVGFGFARVLWTGMADGCKHNLNPYLNHSELMPNLNHSELMSKLKPYLNHSELMPNLIP